MTLLRLSLLQRAIATRVLERAPDFFIAKEAALVLHGGHRPADLLDLSATSHDDALLATLGDELEEFARERSYEVRTQAATPFMRWLVFRGGGETCAVTLRLSQPVLDRERATLDGLSVETRREVRAWLLGRVHSKEDLVDLSRLLEGTSYREAVADAWALTDDAQPGLVAWALAQVEIDPKALPPDVDPAALEALRQQLLLEAERQAAEATLLP